MHKLLLCGELSMFTFMCVFPLGIVAEEPPGVCYTRQVLCPVFGSGCYEILQILKYLQDLVPIQHIN